MNPSCIFSILFLDQICYKSLLLLLDVIVMHGLGDTRKKENLAGPRGKAVWRVTTLLPWNLFSFNGKIPAETAQCCL